MEDTDIRVMETFIEVGCKDPNVQSCLREIEDRSGTDWQKAREEHISKMGAELESRYDRNTPDGMMFFLKFADMAAKANFEQYGAYQNVCREVSKMTGKRVTDINRLTRPVLMAMFLRSKEDSLQKALEEC